MKALLAIVHKGKGVARDYVEWFREAAEQNYARAQCSLGVYYLHLLERLWSSCGLLGLQWEPCSNEDEKKKRHQLKGFHNCQNSRFNRTGRGFLGLEEAGGWILRWSRTHRPCQ